MTVRDLMRKLVEFNPDAEVEVVVNHETKFSEFSVAFGAFEPEGVNEEKTKKVSIYLIENQEYYEECNCYGCER